MSVESGRMLSHYRLVEKIGAGGMGVVWKAEDTVLDRTVAIKVLPVDLALDEKRRKMFLREARLAASVSHGNIVQIYELGNEDDLDFIAMEFVQGQPLNKLLHGRPLPADKVVQIGLQVAQGLSCAHRKKLIHRDLKPENILITREGDAKIADFGLATLFSPRYTTTDSARATTTIHTAERDPSVEGTLPYMSPEQLRGDRLDPRSDVFSFGAVLYEMTTGQRPFESVNSPSLVQQILHSKPVPVHQLVANVPLDLDRIIEKALEPRPTDRYQHTDDMVVDLNRLSKEIDSGSSPTYADLKNRARRPKPLRLVLAILSVLLISLGTWMGWSLLSRDNLRNQPRVTRLTGNPPDSKLQDAAISPDGQYLAYVKSGDLYVQEIRTGESRVYPVVDGGTSSVRWYQDGANLLAGQWSGDVSGLWKVSQLAGSRRKIMDADDVITNASISPDGKLLLFQRRHIETWIANADGSQPRQLLKENSFSPVWSPDSRRVAYMGFGKEGICIETCDLMGSSTVVLGPDFRLQPITVGVWPSHLAWLPDGRIVYPKAMPAPFQRSFELWTIELDAYSGAPTGEEQKLFGWDGSTLFRPTASADGKKLCFFRIEAEDDVYLVDLAEIRDDSVTPRRITFDERDDFPIGWSEDSRRIYFRSNRNSRWQIFSQEVSQQNATLLFDGPSDERQVPWLAPSGSTFMFWQHVESAWNLMSVPVSGGAPESVANFALPWRIKCAGATDSLCIIAEYDSLGILFSTMSTNGRKDKTIARLPRIGVWDVSPDGTRIAGFVRPDSIDVIDVDNGQITKLYLKWDSQALAWSHDGRHLFVTGMGYHVARVGLDGTFKVLSEFQTAWPYRPLPSPNGRYLAFGLRAYDDDIWMIEDF